MKDTFNQTFNSVTAGAPFRLMTNNARSYIGGTTTSAIWVAPDGSWDGTIKLKCSADGKDASDGTKRWVEIGTYTAAGMATIICPSNDFDYMVECTARSAGTCQVVVK